jgi:hypothetical protein
LKIRQQVEHAFRGKGVHYQLWASSPEELRYEVSVPFDQDIRKLAKIIKRLDGRGASVDWDQEIQDGPDMKEGERVVHQSVRSTEADANQGAKVYNRVSVWTARARLSS